MKQLIKSATVYKADFGTITNSSELHNALAGHSFAECTSLELRSVGFVPPTESCSLAVPFTGGWAFRVRIDEKQIPASTVNQKVDAAVAIVSAETHRRVGKKERAQIKDQVLTELAPKALARTASITCFYQQATGYLIVPTTSKKLTDYILTALVQAAGSVKTETTHVSNVKHGLTTRLKAWSDGDDDAFGVFDPCAEAALQEGDRKIAIKMRSLRGAETGIKETLASGFEVTSMGFDHEGQTEFRLTHDFKLKRIEFAHTDAEDDDEVTFESQAALEVDALSAVITDLVAMIGHGDEEQEAAE